MNPNNTNRQSLFPSNLQLHSTNNQLAHIQSCAQSVAFSCDTLWSTIETLSSSTSDLPRLSSVLQNKKHFDLVSEAEIIQARDFLRDEMTPQVKQLILMAENALESEEAKERLKRNKVSQLTARLDQLVASLPPSERERARANARSIAGNPSHPQTQQNESTNQASQDGEESELRKVLMKERNRLKELKKQKEQLSRKVEGLEKDDEKFRAEAEILKKASSKGPAKRMA